MYIYKKKILHVGRSKFTFRTRIYWDNVLWTFSQMSQHGLGCLYDLSIHNNGRVLNVSFALDHPQLQLCRAGPLPRAGCLWTNRQTESHSTLRVAYKMSVLKLKEWV